MLCKIASRAYVVLAKAAVDARRAQACAQVNVAVRSREADLADAMISVD